MKDSALLERRELNLTGDTRNGNISGGSGNSPNGNSSRLALHENTLPVRIEMLKNVALNLLKEVQVLSTLEAADIVRGIQFYDEVERFERELITRALELTGGHQVRASRLLGLKVTTLNSKVKRYQIPLPHDAAASAASQAQQETGPFPKPVS
ncbi:MAG TPA: helix-turn-helix domain-containing protein [Pyrinomonadaceae bacterium]|jgi:DNA-binding protein Fis|nr:helix-turn-helix domain-containing protein [Pyrinomonadaceae bacterium]